MNLLRDLRTKDWLKRTSHLLFAVSITALLLAYPAYHYLSSLGAYEQDGYHTYMECEESTLVVDLTDTLGQEYIWAWESESTSTFSGSQDPNFFYKITDNQTGQVLEASQELGDYREKNAQRFHNTISWDETTVTETYDSYTDRSRAMDAIKTMDPDASIEILDLADDKYWMSATYTPVKELDVTVTGFLRVDLEPQGYVWQQLTEAQNRYVMKDAMLITVTLGGLLTLVTFAFSTWATGWRKGEARPGMHGDEISAFAALILGGIATVAGLVITGNHDLIIYVTPMLSDQILLALRLGLCFLCALVGLWCWLNLVRRWKTRDWKDPEGTVWGLRARARRLWDRCKGGLRWLADNLAHFRVLAAVTVVLVLLEVFFLAVGAVPLWLLLKIPQVVLVLYVGVALNRLKQGGREIADGNVNYQIPLENLKGDFRTHAEHLNHIREAIQVAVEEQMKSERMKTELITNVSHDIKTPLTSIISYVDLLKKQEMPTEEAKEYLEVLDRQAAKLKKLTEDLVEAAKATAGTVPVDFKPTDVNVLLAQSAGEYQERLQAKGLTLLLTPAPGDPVISADGRLLWRVFENLLSNIHKYALPGTRVYLTCVADLHEVTITFRNISAEPLNISPDELMERFVRGDDARHTEGSGLGLSIARSLTQLQMGTFDLSIDGDLFKAILTFPRSE